MPESRQVHVNAVSDPPRDTVQEAVWRLKVPDNQEGYEANAYPHRPGEPDCTYYLKTGLCGYGSNCRFNHPSHALQVLPYKSDLPQRAGQPDCRYYIKTGTCKYGSSCKYHHPWDRNGAAPVFLNILGLPMREDEKSCPYYMRTGLCNFGAACKFHHPQPSMPGGIMPVAAPSAEGALGSSSTYSSGIPYFGGLSTLPGTRGEGQQAYIPVLYSPSQGILPTQCWNTYLGNISPISSSGILGPSFCSSRNQAETGSCGQLNLLSTSLSSYPERPDQPECRHFMNTGSCKYGSNCRFHHPKEKLAQLANMGFHGLPSRPGLPVCSNYNLYGICKFGPACKFDHPGAGYSYSLSLPPLSLLDPSLLSHTRSWPAACASEASLSKSSKVSEWVQKPEQSSDNQDDPAAVGTSEGQPEQADSPPHLPPTPDTPQGQSE